MSSPRSGRWGPVLRLSSIRLWPRTCEPKASKPSRMLANGSWKTQRFPSGTTGKARCSLVLRPGWPRRGSNPLLRGRNCPWTRSSLRAIRPTTSIFWLSAGRRTRCGSPRTSCTPEAFRLISGGPSVEFDGMRGRCGCLCPYHARRAPAAFLRLRRALNRSLSQCEKRLT